MAYEYESHNGDYSDAESLFENDPYEFIEDESAFADDESLDERSPRGRRPRGGHRQAHRRIMMAIRRLASRIQRIQMQLRRMGQETGTPVNISKRLRQMEQQVSGFKQNQLMALLLNQPELGSIKFSDDERPRKVESSTYSKDSLLMMQLLNQQESSLGMQGDLGNCLLPLLLLGDDDQQGGFGKDPLTMILLLQMLNKK